MMELTFTPAAKTSKSLSNVIRRAECRICLKNDGILPIFGDEAKPDISMEIALFGGIQLSENDDLPKFICELCFKQLEGGISFRKSAKRSEILLKKRRKNNERNKKSEMFVKPFSLVASNEPHESEMKAEDLQLMQLEENESKSNIDFICVEASGVTSSFADNIKHEKEGTSQEIHDEVMECHDASDSDNEPLIRGKSKGLAPKSSIHCHYCNLKFSTLDKLEEHRTTVEHKRNYVMSFLPKKKVALNKKDNFCEMCQEWFSKPHYSKHMLAQHNIRQEKRKSSLAALKKECPECQKLFQPSALNNHMKKVHGKSIDPKVKLECPICKKMFSKLFYPLHVKRHKQGDNKNFICDQCGKKFFFQSSFFTHRLIHTNDLPHKCEYCPYRGRTKDLLKIHVRTHTGDYPYKCTQCDTRCSTKSNLNSHTRRRHRGPIDFVCDACNRGFYSKIQLERHISVTHYGVKNHICPTCGAAFGYRHGMMSHQRKVHKRPKGLGKPKAVYLRLEEEGLLQPLQEL